MQSSYSQLNQTKLPEIHQNQNKTITPKNLLSISTQAFDKNVFNKALQKIDIKLEKKEKIDSELNEVKSEFIKASVNTLMNNSDQDWKLLEELIFSIKKCCKFMENDRRLNHYIERIYFYTSKTPDREPCKKVLDALVDVFPKLVGDIKEHSIDKNFPILPKTSEKKIEIIDKKPPPSLVSDANINFYEGKLGPYDLKLKDVKLKTTTGPKLSDLAKSIPKITIETFQMETNWKNKLSTLAVAASVNFQDIEPAEIEDAKKGKKLFADIKSDAEPDNLIDINYHPLLYQRAPEPPENYIRMTGRELVSYLIKANHLGEVKSFYLNFESTDDYKPYSLVTVPKNLINPEHFIFSVFGVLHVVPNDDNENLSLAEWNRHAVLWEACRKIKFFKQFLIQKFFIRWRQNSKFSKFYKLRNLVTKSMVIAVPDYSYALLCINKLALEALNIKFLPIHEPTMDESSPPKTYNLDSFMDTVFKLSVKSEESLKRFFIFIKYIINEIREAYFEKLRFYQRVLNQEDIVNMKNSMVSQKLKRQEIQKKYDEISREISLLGNFMNLVSAIISSNLLQLQRIQITQFVKNVIECTKQEREAVFTAELTFRDDMFGMWPPKEKYLSTIVGALTNVSNTMINTSLICNFSGELWDTEKYGHKIDKPLSTLRRERLNKTPEELDEEQKFILFEQQVLEETVSNNEIKKPILKPREVLDKSLIRIPNVLPFKEDVLKIKTFQLTAQSNPLQPISLFSTLKEDPVLEENVKIINRLVDEAMNDVELYCQENSWISAIKAYITEWTIDLVEDWKAIGAFKIDEELAKIRRWIENVKVMDKIILTTNKVFKIDCSSVETILVPHLDSIYTEICEKLVQDNTKSAQEYIAQLTKILKQLEHKPDTIEEFAYYAKMAFKHKANMSSFGEKSNLIKLLWEVIRGSYRPLNTDEEVLDSQSQELYKSFIYKLQESIEFVNSQSPNIMNQILTLYKQYRSDLEAIYHKGTTGIFLDPLQDPTEILVELKSLCYEFSTCEKILKTCIGWKESITNQIEDVSFIEVMSKKLNIRKDLWKYYQVSFYHIKDWKNSQIKKLNVKKIEEKVDFWENEALKLKKHVSEGDRVWLNWWNLLQAFKMNMKWASKLASEQFKTEHFNELFSAIGLNYDPNKAYTLQELIDLNLDEHAELINRIYKRALSELQLTQQFSAIEQLWSNKLLFNLAKHFPISIYKIERFMLSSATQHIPNVTPQQKSQRVKELRTISRKQQTQQKNLITEVSYKLVDIHEIRYFVEDSLIQLNMLLQSPIISLIKTKVETLKDKLNQVLTIAELWLEVQHKWLYLERALNENNETQSTHDILLFHQVAYELKAFQNRVMAEPLVLNIVKQENIKSKLTEWSYKLDQLCMALEKEVEDSCYEFPRFYFLNKNQLIETLSYIRDCRKYMGTVRLCFPGIQSLVYQLPKSAIASLANTNKSDENADINKEATEDQAPVGTSAAVNTQFNFDIYANELEVSSIVGYNGLEKFDLVLPLSSYDLQKTSEWFENLLKLMKSSLSFLTQEYLSSFAESGGDYSSIPIITKRNFDLTSIPVQCILLTEALIWSDNMKKLIETNRTEDIKYIFNYLNKSIAECSSLQTSNCEKRLKEILSKLVLYYIYQREVTQNLMRLKDLNYSSYEWQVSLKYEFDSKSILKRLSSKYEDGKNVKLVQQLENFQLVQLTNRVYYDFEYLDLSNQLAITPLTERCLLSLTTALKTLRCGTLVGANSVGKTETVRLLSQLSGQHLFSVNCTEYLTNRVMKNYIKGLAGSGSWILFEKMENLTPNVLSYVAHQLEYLSNSIKTLLDKNEPDIDDPVYQRTLEQMRPNTAQDTQHRNKRIKTVPATFQIAGIKSYFEDPYTDMQIPPVEKKKIPKVPLKFKDKLRIVASAPSTEDELRRINRFLKYGQSKLDEYYQRHWLGFIRFQGRIIKVNSNYGCFITLKSYEKLPENLRHNLRMTYMIEPDYKHIISCLLTSHGLNQGLTDTEILAKKIVYFLLQLKESKIENKFIKECCNLTLIIKAIRLIAKKYVLDKGRPERTICMILTLIFYPCLKNEEEKSIFNLLLRQTFNYEIITAVEELLSNVIKEQLEAKKLYIDSKQLQNMIDLYTGLRFNRSVIICGPPLSGKSVILKAILTVINNVLQSNQNDQIKEETNKENSTSNTKTSEFLRRYSLLSLLLEDNKYKRVHLHKIYPNVYDKSQLYANQTTDPHTKQTNLKYGLLTKLVRQADNFISSVNALREEQTENKNKPPYVDSENWILLDGAIYDTCLFDELALLKGDLKPFNSTSNEINNSVKFLFETTDISNITPTILSETLFITQNKIHWKHILESKISLLTLKFMLPQARTNYIQELSQLFFTETEKHINESDYKSILHAKLELKKLNMVNYVLSYLNLIDCLLDKHLEDLKKTDTAQGDLSVDPTNWNLLNCLCCFSYFWSFASFISSNDDLNKFNTFAVQLLTKNECSITQTENLRLYDCEINLKTSSLLQVKRVREFGRSRDAILPDYSLYSILLQICLKYSKPFLIYGDIGCGKTSFIEKVLSNKGSFVKVNNMEPYNNIYETITKHTELAKAKLATLNTKNKFIYFLDDININNSCSNHPSLNKNFDLMRQILETNTIYSFDEESYITLSECIFVASCAIPTHFNPNYQTLDERLTRHFICVYMNSNRNSVLESLFLPTVQHWLEEFPVDQLQYPLEMAGALIKSLLEVYRNVIEKLKPVPSKPHYFFNLRDLTRVIQGLQLVASKTKVKPKNVKKTKKKSRERPASPPTVQNANIVKLYCHELFRVFSDRMNDQHDEFWFRSMLYKVIIADFCTPKGEDTVMEEKSVSDDDNEDQQLDENKPLKKAVTFKTGLLSERNAAEFYRGALINIDQFAVSNEEALANLTFSKYIMKQSDSAFLGDKATQKSVYFESSVNELVVAANAAVFSYEQITNTRTTFHFHEDAVKHLARLTRILSMTKSHALLLSSQFGLGRTSLVRFAAHISKMKYFEPRVCYDESKNEEYLKSIFRQCSLFSGIKASHCIIYIKMEYYSHQVIEAILSFVRTGIFPGLFNEDEICQIANQIIPSISALKRTERTLFAFNTFLKSVQERLHLIISFKSCQSQTELINLFRSHTILCNEFYIDQYKPFKIEFVQAIARNYLNDRIAENRNKHFDRFESMIVNEINEDTDTDRQLDEDDYLDLKDIDSYSTILANLHVIAYSAYLKVYLNNANITRSKPFSVAVFKQIYTFYFVYMKRIFTNEKVKFDKYNEVFKKLDYVRDQIRKYGEDILKLKDHLVVLDRRLSDWNARIDKQKAAYKVAVDECREEEKLVEEMGAALDKLRANSNQDFQELKQQLNPQYEAALRALNALSENSIAELRSYRLPPQRVLAVVNTLCVMFGKEPNWDEGKLLLLREHFYEELVYYDKANISDDIFYKLEKIIALETFKPDEVRPGSEAAASLCEWIIAVFEYCSVARTISSKEREIREYEELYKTRQTKLGEKRLYAEKEREILESYCQERIGVLREINHTQKEIEHINDSRSNAEYLLKLLDNDTKIWHKKSTQSKQIMQTYKTDALLAACYMAYAGIFDYEQREKLLAKWLDYFKNSDLNSAKIKFFNTELPENTGESTVTIPKYSIRPNFDIKDIVIEPSDKNREIWLQIDLMSHNDRYYINNAVILRELCANPTINWPVFYDPEYYSLKLLLLLQGSINSLKENYVNEMLVLWNREESKRRDSQMMGALSEDGDIVSVSRRQSAVPSHASDSLSRSASRISRKSYGTQISERSSIWETSTFLSRAYTNASVYYTKSGKTFLPKFDDDIDQPLPLIEHELQGKPKDNLWIIDSLDSDLDYKIANAAVHGVVVYLRNAERRQYSRIIEKVINRDFLVDSYGRETIKVGDEQVKIHPAFKLILHVNTPIHVFNSKYNYLCQRFSFQNTSSNSSIDFTPSYNYITTDLLNTILDYEKSGYINQCLLAEKLFNEAQYEIMNREEEIINKLSSMKEQLLDDKKIIDYMQTNNMKLRSYMDAQDESYYSMKFLVEKRKDYMKMSKTVASIFDALKYLLLIQPVYYVNWSMMKQLLINEIKTVLKEKGATGAARASEIEAFCLNLFYRYLSSSMSKEHFQIFVFFHSFWMSVKKHWMKKSDDEIKFDKFVKKDPFTKTPKTNKPEFDLSEYLVYYSLSNSLKTARQQTDVPITSYTHSHLKKPKFISINNWLSCIQLEKTIPKVFEGLTESLANESDKWSEYFHYDDVAMETDAKINLGKTEAKLDIDLLNQCPLKNDSLNIFLKFLLWTTAQSHLLIPLVNKFNTYNFGGLIPTHHEFDIHHFFSLTSPYRPNLVLVNKSVNSYVDIKSEITERAKQVNTSIKVIVFALDDDEPRNMQRFYNALSDSIKNGNWIIVDNIHLVKVWTPDIFQLLYQIKEAQNLDFDEKYQDFCSNNILHSAKSKSSISRSNINDKHRLWFICDSDLVNNLPSTLIFDAVKFTPKISDFVRTRQVCNDIAYKQQEMEPEMMNQVSILHSVISHMNFIDHKYLWRLDNYHDYLKQHLNVKLNYGCHNTEKYLNKLLKNLIYGVHATNKMDQTLINNLIKQISEKKDYTGYESKKAVELFNTKYETEEEIIKLRNQLQQIFNFCKEISADHEHEPLTSIVDKENHDAFNFEFDPVYVKNLQKFLSNNLQTAIDQLKSHIDNFDEMIYNDEKSTEPNAKPSTLNKNLINELKGYLDLFENLSIKFNYFINATIGDHSFNKQEVRQYSILITYTNQKHKLNFYELTNQLINSSFKILKILNETSNMPTIIDLNILLNTKRYLQDFIQNSYLNSVYERQPNTTAAMLIKNEQTFFKAMDLALPDFILEVIDGENITIGDNKSLLVKNLYIRNAYYDHYMNAFKATPLNNEYETVIKYSKLTPIIGNENILNVELNTLKSVPLLQNSNDRICNLYVKFSKRKTISNGHKIDDDLELDILNSIYFFIDNYKDEVFDEFIY